MDGTGILFESLLEELSKDIEVQIISYPCDKNLSYRQLIDCAKEKLPQREDNKGTIPLFGQSNDFGEA